MALILTIDTATEVATVALARKGIVMHAIQNSNMNAHASWVHSALQELISTAAVSVSSIQAIGITAGPGSYTGLRVGMATAKGLCYALKIPLIVENTLKVMAKSAIAHNTKGNQMNGREIYLPMIDARRMEVFAAAYDSTLACVFPPAAVILDESSFSNLSNTATIYCFGNGSKKFNGVTKHPNFRFINLPADATALSILSYEKYLKQDFADLAYAEPFYLKEFYGVRKN